MKTAALLLTTLSALLAVEPTVHISGTILKGLTQQKIAGARVFLTPAAANGGKELTLITKPDGRFEFNVPPGKYGLTAETPTIYRQRFGGRTSPIEIGVSIIAKPGENVEDLAFPLFSPATIRGRILDPNGEPVEDSLVELLRKSTGDGLSQVRPFQWRYTDDLGEFRFGLLPAGTYYVAVTARPWYTLYSAINSDAIAHDAYLPAYYPGTVDITAAVALELKPAQEERADFSLTPTRGVAVTVNCPACTPDSLVDLLSPGIRGVQSPNQVVSLYGHTAVLRSTPPGNYTVRIRARDDPQGKFATAHVSVQQEDVTVQVNAGNAPVVQGHITPEAGQSLPAGLQIRIVDRITSRPLTRNVSPQGDFSLPGVIPSTYQVFVLGVPGIYASSVKLDGRESRIIEIPDAGTIDLKIVAGIGLATVKGYAYLNGVPTYGAIVILSPEGLPNEPDRYYGFQTDSDGSFNLESVRPGAYRIFAVARGNFEYRTPAAIRPFLDAAKKLEVGPGDRFSEKVEVLP